MHAAKRALRGRRLAMVFPAGLGALGAVALFAATIAPVLLTGAPRSVAAAYLPALESGFGAALGVFMLGLAALLLVIYVVALMGQGLRRSSA